MSSTLTKRIFETSPSLSEEILRLCVAIDIVNVDYCSKDYTYDGAIQFCVIISVVREYQFRIELAECADRDICLAMDR